MRFFIAILLVLSLILIHIFIIDAPRIPTEPLTTTSTTEAVQLPSEALLEVIEPITRSGAQDDLYLVTAYDLSVQSCGKRPSHPEYGITASGIDLEGKEFPSTRVIAVDPKIIPLGSFVSVKFIDDNYSKYNGIYTAGDTGSAIIGNHIDLYLGEAMTDEAMSFGKTEAFVEVLQ